MGDLTLVPDKPLTAKESLRMSLENVVPLINPKTDFASIKGKIEPTRDLILKLIDPFMLSFDTDLKEKERVGEITYYTFKAEVRGLDGRTVTGWGKCGTDEVNGERAEHDAMTKAETRALKRAIEAKAGFGMVNQLIMHFFGGFEQKGARNVTPEMVENAMASPDVKETEAGEAPREYSGLRAKAKKLEGEGKTEEAEDVRKKAKALLFEKFGPAMDYYLKKKDDGTWMTMRVEAVPTGAGVPDDKVQF